MTKTKFAGALTAVTLSAGMIVGGMSMGVAVAEPDAGQEQVQDDKAGGESVNVDVITKAGAGGVYATANKDGKIKVGQEIPLKLDAKGAGMERDAKEYDAWVNELADRLKDMPDSSMKSFEALVKSGMLGKPEKDDSGKNKGFIDRIVAAAGDAIRSGEAGEQVQEVYNSADLDEKKEIYATLVKWQRGESKDAQKELKSNLSRAKKNVKSAKTALQDFEKEVEQKPFALNNKIGQARVDELKAEVREAEKDRDEAAQAAKDFPKPEAGLIVRTTNANGGVEVLKGAEAGQAMIELSKAQKSKEKMEGMSDKIAEGVAKAKEKVEQAEAESGEGGEGQGD